MKVNLISFQEKAVQGLREDIADALDNYRRRGKTQVVSLQAPTGAGKTIIAAALIENIFFGSTLANGTTFDEQPEAIFVWLSDSPELNAQSKQKIELKTSKLRFGQCVTIAEDAFDMEMLEDGHKLSVQVFDPFGKALQENYFNDFTLMSETDLDRQVRNADAKLGGYGFPSKYGGRYYDEENPNAHKIDCVLFAADESCRAKLGEYAKNKLREFSHKYRVAVANKSDTCKKKYREIMADSAVVSEQLFAIPENISVREDPDGVEYENHLLAASDTGIAKIKLNGWESALIEEESHRTDFVCWLRNPAKAAWALCLPYDLNGEKKSFYPDFLIVRRDSAVDYVVDILEPHGNQYADNLPKAKALAEYAKTEDRIGRIQLIHKTMDAGGNNRFVRLELTDIVVRDKVLRAMTIDELNHIFDTDGIFE